MSYNTFKENMLSYMRNQRAINSKEEFAAKLVNEYDALIKRGFDTVNGIVLSKGNTDLMYTTLVGVLETAFQQPSGEHAIITNMGKAFQAYWTTPYGIGELLNIINDALVLGKYEYKVELETDTELNRIINETRVAVDGARQSPDANGFGSGVTNLTGVKSVTVTPVNNNGEPTNTKPATKRVRKAGVPDITDIDPELDWVAMAMKYMISREHFTPAAKNDQGNPRLGYGTSTLFVSNGKNGVPVTRTVRYGDTTTQEHALIVLEYEVKTKFKYRVVTTKATDNGKDRGNQDYTIRPSDWDALSDGQKAACICFCYNCGSFYYNARIAKAIRDKDYEAAAVYIQNGPTRGAETKEVLPGLVKRRAEESMLFRLV